MINHYQHNSSNNNIGTTTDYEDNCNYISIIARIRATPITTVVKSIKQQQQQQNADTKAKYLLHGLTPNTFSSYPNNRVQVKYLHAELRCVPL